jgi:hypothetical protein
MLVVRGSCVCDHGVCLSASPLASTELADPGRICSRAHAPAGPGWARASVAAAPAGSTASAATSTDAPPSRRLSRFLKKMSDEPPPDDGGPVEEYEDDDASTSSGLDPSHPLLARAQAALKHQLVEARLRVEGVIREKTEDLKVRGCVPPMLSACLNCCRWWHVETGGPAKDGLAGDGVWLYGVVTEQHPCSRVATGWWGSQLCGPIFGRAVGEARRAGSKRWRVVIGGLAWSDATVLGGWGGDQGLTSADGMSR